MAWYEQYKQKIPVGPIKRGGPEWVTTTGGVMYGSAPSGAMSYTANALGMTS